MTRHEHHHSFSVGPGHLSHHRVSSRGRTNTTDSESSVQSIRNLGDAPDLGDDVDVVAAVGAMRALASFKSLRVGGTAASGSGGGGNRRGFAEGGVGVGAGTGIGHATPRSSPSSTRPSMPAFTRRIPSFDAAVSSPRGSSRSGSPMVKGGSPDRKEGLRRRAWTAEDADLLSLRERGGGGGGGGRMVPSRGETDAALGDNDRDGDDLGSHSTAPLPKTTAATATMTTRRLRSSSSAEAESDADPPGPPPGASVPTDDAQNMSPSTTATTKTTSSSSALVGSGGDAQKNRPVPFSRHRLRPVPLLDVEEANVPDGMTREGVSNWLAGATPRGFEPMSASALAAYVAGWEDDGLRREMLDREEEKRELAAEDDGKSEEGAVFSGTVAENGNDPWSSVPLSLSLARRLPPRNEASFTDDRRIDSVRGPGMGHFHPLSLRPPTIQEEPSLGVTSGTETTDGDADTCALSSPEERSRCGKKDGSVSAQSNSNRDYRVPVGASRFDFATGSERGEILKSVQWVSSRTSSSFDDDQSHLPDYFDDDGMHYTDSPMQTPSSAAMSEGYYRGGYDEDTNRVGTTLYSQGPESGILRLPPEIPDDNDNIDHRDLSDRHGDQSKKKRVAFNHVFSTPAGYPDKGAGDRRNPVFLFGRRVPLLRWPLFRVNRPSWSRVSSFIVRNAPCFWCSQRFEASATDRAILVRLNVLSTCFAAVQVGSGLFLLLVQWSSDGTEEENHLRRQSLTPNLWTLNGMIFLLALVGLVLIVTMISTLRVIREVNLAGALRYMWALYWLLPIEILLVIGLFDYHRVTDVWIKHWWATPSLEWFRDLFCYADTSHTKCIVPIGGGAGYGNEEDWCLRLYNATDCRLVRDVAQEKMRTASYIFVTVNGVWGSLLVVLLFLALTLLEGLITAPIVQSSKQTNVPWWLTLPIIGCLVGGAVLLFSPSSATAEVSANNVFWIGVTYMTSAGTFFIAALLGWFISAFSVLNNRDKQQKLIAIMLFIVTMVLASLSVAAIFSASLIYSANIVDVGFNDVTRGNIACYLDTADSCTNCDRKVRRCPEWTTVEVVQVLQTQLKQSATLAAILSIYAISALRFGFILRKHLTRYQIDYV